MSYIRGLSNPEGLYIWGEGDGTVYICHNLISPFSSSRHEHGEQLQVPRALFEEVCCRWAERRFTNRGSAEDGIRRSGLSVREESTKRDLNWKIRFEYEGRFFYMWQVTWDYIVRGVLERHPKRGEVPRVRRP